MGWGDCIYEQAEAVKGAFAPEEKTAVRDRTLALLGSSPSQCGVERTRWRLADLCGRMIGVGAQVFSRSGVRQVLARFDIRYRRGWEYLVSPDPLALDKLRWIEAIHQRQQEHPDQVVVCWLDELTFYRLPSAAKVWAPAQGRGPKMKMVSASNTTARLIGALNARTGQLHYLRRSQAGVHELQLLYRTMRQAYPNAQEVYVIQDCWPVHFLPEVCQTALSLGITLVPLPTYSSWRNPIEKVWRFLKQEVLHMHRWADDWLRLKAEVTAFLDRFSAPNTVLLRYVGLPT
jgi:DDE superfamily endonuclease